MTKGNIILFVVLLGVMGAWVAGRETGGESHSLAPRVFPTLNKEYVDAIQIAGGWQGTEYVIARRGSEWFVASAGGYEVEADAAEKFLDAVANLRRDNEVGESEDLGRRTHTDDVNGRLVRLLGGGEVICAFRIGKSPKGGNEEVYVRVDDKKTIYRTRTILTKDREREFETQKSPFGGGGVRGFEWHNYVNNLSTRWVKTDVWDLKGAEVDELWLMRPGDDAIDARLIKKADDKWDLVADGKETVPGDADVADAIINPLRGLQLTDVVGLHEQVGSDYGFDAPTRTLVLKLRRKIEKKADEKKEGDEKVEKKDEYKSFKRILEVGAKVTRKKYDAYGDKFTDDEYYAVRISPASEFEDEKERDRTRFVFLVNSYGVDPLGKKLEDFKQKAEEDKDEGDEGDEGDGPVKKDGDAGDKDDAPVKKDDAPVKKDDDAPVKKDDDVPAKKDADAPAQKD
ncbi:MAG: DUF4340 domain-containing protein, partial [Planctomycetota bacterium]|nr:DUF4340 domain-containing protein [Planctomycetota bacterium]